LESAAQATGLQVQIFYAGTLQEIDVAFASLVRERYDALFVGTDPFSSSRRVQLVTLAMRHAIPTAFPNRESAEIGGLVSYGSDIADAWRQCGAYAGRILRGIKPAAPGGASEQVPACHQCPDRECHGPYRAAFAACHRRRGDRVKRRENENLAARLNEFWAARGREAGERAADRVLLACREVTDDSEAIALLDARRKHIVSAEKVLRKDGIGEADIATFKREAALVYDSEVAPLRTLLMLSKAEIIKL
jgi:hypothetical protein